MKRTYLMPFVAANAPPVFGNDFYPGGLVVPDPYSNYPTWYADVVNGVDIGSPGNVKPAGYIYKTYDNALLDVFYVGNPGFRRIIVRAGTYIPGGSLSANRGSYFPAGGPDAAHPCVIQGDPANTTLPLIDAQLGGVANITGISLGATTTVTFGDPLSGVSRQPFVVNEIIQFGNITNAAGTSLNGQAGTVTATGGSAGAWTVTVNINSSGGYGAWISGGQVWWGGPSNGHPAFAIGVAGTFSGAQTSVNHIVIRKIEIANSVDDSVYFNNGTSTDVSVQYCYFHGNRYTYNNPSSAGAIGITTFNCLSNLTVSHCKFADIGLRPGGASISFDENCVPFETYGTDNVTFQNCSFDGAYKAIRLKLAQSGSGPGTSVGSANNYTIKNCIFSHNYAAIQLGTGFTLYKAVNNWTVTGNLFYGPPLFVTGDNSAYAVILNGTVDSGFGRGAGNIFSNNTIAEDMVVGFYWNGTSDITVRDNVSILSNTGSGNAKHLSTSSGVGSTWFTSADNVTFTELDYNAYGATAIWTLDFTEAPYQNSYSYSTWAQWQAAYTTPLGPGAPTAPTDLATTGNPDPHGLWIPNLSVSYNTVAKNFPNAGSRDYTIAAGSPLLTASSTSGRMGYDPTNVGPGW